MLKTSTISSDNGINSLNSYYFTYFFTEQAVPIPMVTLRCDTRCCSATFCPLELSFGMTLHTFQGQSAGPVDKGQPKNSVDRVIVEPGTRSFEGNNPGTAYMACSRATTIGTGKLDSALYFTGPNANRFRFHDVKHQKGAPNKSRQLYKKVELRDKWVARLEANTQRPAFSQEEVNKELAWCNTFTMDQQTLDKALSTRHWRTKGI